MSMVCVLRQIEEAEIGPLLANPEQILEILEADAGGDEDEETGEPEVDLDRAWHGIHYLLNGSAWGGDPPLSYLMSGGQTVGDVSVGYGPARALRPRQVLAFADALSTITADDLRARFNPAAMMRAEVYPAEIWHRDSEEDDPLGYLLGNFEVLQSFLRQTSKQDKGLLIYLT